MAGSVDGPVRSGVVPLILVRVQPNLSTKELRAIVALSHTRNFGQAADQLHLSPSALSALVARVETQLAARLFERTTRAVELTDAGQVFVQHAQALLRDTYSAVQAVQDRVHLRTGRVAVAAMPSLAAAVVPQIFALFHAHHPLVQLSLIDTLSSMAFSMVRDGKVDLALTAADPQQADLRYEPLTTDEFVLICPCDHALALHPGPVSIEQTLAYGHVSMPTSASVRQYVDAHLRSTGQRFEPIFEVDHIATIGALVAAGLGVSVLPETAVVLLAHQGLVHRPLALPGIQRPLGLVSRRHSPMSAGAAAMRALVKEHFLAKA